MSKKMTDKRILRHITILREKVREHEYRYYVENNPIISDVEFDRLIDELSALEKEYPAYITPDSPTQRVGGEPVKEFKNISHRIPMLSLDNTYSIEELLEWEKRITKLYNGPISYVVEPKIDGVSLSLIYKKGILGQALTRGNGTIGEDITSNAKTIKNIPLRLKQHNHIPEIFELRGEAYMEKNTLDELNKTRALNDEPIFANPRNATAGSLKLLDSRVTAQRKIHFFAHSRGFVSDELQTYKTAVTTHSDFLKQLKHLGIPVSSYIKKCKDIDEAVFFCKELEEKRDTLSFEIDGAVIKVDAIAVQEVLGTTLKSPRWAVAFKFTARQATTVVIAIKHQVGRTGVITPVADLEPVECSGVTISHATLHNYDEIKRLGISSGDRVLIERAGDVIPKIIKVIKKSSSHTKHEVKPPENCPVCGGELIKEKEEDVAYRCVNNTCPAQLARGLEHFASRSAMDIEGLGAAVIEQLVEKKLIQNIADIYTLKKEDFLALELFADKKAENLINAIEESKKNSLHKLIFGLGIRNVGEKAAITLAEKYHTLDALQKADQDSLLLIHEIGPVMTDSIITYFSLPSTKKVIEKMRANRVNFTAEYRKNKSEKLSGMTVVVTGEIEGYSRLHIEQLIRDHSGKPSSSVSKKTDMVVIGENPGSKKEKAEKLGIKIISSAEFLKMLE